jgi:tight adherence protein B
MSLAVVTFGVVFAAIVGAYWLLVQRPEQQEVDVVRGRIKGKRSTKRSAVTGQLELQARETGFSSFDALLKRASAKTAPLQLLIDQSGVKIGLGRLFLVSAVLAALVFVGVLWIAPDAEWSLVVVPLALAAAAFAAFVPFAVLKMQRGKRLRKFEEQFPEALDLLARALRAGHAFTSCLEMVADDMPAPAGAEFRRLFDQQNYGMPLPDALREFATRIMLLDARFFATAVLIQRESGGNLSEVLDKLAGVIRTRFKVKRQMRVVSAHGRITGWILAGLPPVVFVVMTAMNPDYRATMFGTKLGVQMLWGAVGLQVIGTLVIRKIINPEY